VAVDFLPGFWVEEGGGRPGVEIWENDEYGFGDPNGFLVLFCHQKRTFPGARTLQKYNEHKSSKSGEYTWYNQY
jgi:hypothetical protein